MKEYKVGVAYERYGYISVTADSEEDAVRAAEARLKAMSIDELEAVTEYMTDSEEVDADAVMLVTEPVGGVVDL